MVITRVKVLGSGPHPHPGPVAPFLKGNGQKNPRRHDRRMLISTVGGDEAFDTTAVI